MPRLLDRLPFPEHASEVAFRTERIRVRADQIILWVTLTLKNVTAPNPSAVPFPVILDTRHSHTFSIGERHLVDWTGLRPETMAVTHAVRDRGQRILLCGDHTTGPRPRNKARIAGLRSVDRSPLVYSNNPFGKAFRAIKIGEPSIVFLTPGALT